jgi:Ca2+-binding RTX toxin-like protein
MLGLLGLFGALFAGYVADGVMASHSKSSDDSADSDENHTEFFESESAPETTSSIEAFLVAQSNSATPAAEDPLLDSDSSDIPASEPENQTILGNSGDDILTGGTGDDIINGDDGVDLLGGRDGDDLIDGGEGEDHIDGGEGADTLLGGLGDDVVQGNDGDDVMAGGDGSDVLSGHMDNDQLDGGDGEDSLLGGSGADTLNGGGAADWVAGGYDDDVLYGGGGQDTLDGNAGNDTLWGFDPDAPQNDTGDDTDFLNGGTGNDTLMIGAGDYAHGGDGADEFTLGDWIGEGDFAHISDYNPDEDDIVVLYDAAAHPDPHVELVTEEGSNDATVLLDGIPLALITDGAGLTVSVLTLMPSNTF